MGGGSQIHNNTRSQRPRSPSPLLAVLRHAASGRVLFVLGFGVGRGSHALSELETLVTPDTLLRWYRTLIARKWDYTHRRIPGRPRTQHTIVELTLRMALENPSWGYTRIQGALGNLGHKVGRGTIANILKEKGIDPAPERGKRTRWSTFLKAHWECLVAADFLSVELGTLRGLVTYHVLFFIDVAAREVHGGFPQRAVSGGS